MAGLRSAGDGSARWSRRGEAGGGTVRPDCHAPRTLIRPRAVEQLVALADAAAERGLDVNVDGLQGHLSSFDFLPAWTRTWHRRNIFTDPDVVEAEAAYLRTLAAALADRPNFIGMTVGNEVNQFAAGPHPDPDRVTPEQAGRWLTRLLAACAEGAPGKLHLHASCDAAWYQDDQPFTPEHSARLGDLTAVHSWVFNGTAQRHGRTGTATEHHAAYLVELSKAWADDPQRPVWLQEVGAPSPTPTAETCASPGSPPPARSTGRTHPPSATTSCTASCPTARAASSAAPASAPTAPAGSPRSRTRASHGSNCARSGSSTTSRRPPRPPIAGSPTHGR
ncbi:glycoside hydrolase 5 family protein [Streptomyces sp. NPDC004008]